MGKVHVLLISIQHFQTSKYCMLMVLINIWKMFLMQQHHDSISSTLWCTQCILPILGLKKTHSCIYCIKKEKHKKNKTEAINPNTIWPSRYMMIAHFFKDTGSRKRLHDFAMNQEHYHISQQNKQTNKIQKLSFIEIH